MFSACLTFAQVNSNKEKNSDPVSFMSIKVAGNLSDFLQKVEAKGFNPTEETNGENISTLKGIYLGQDADVLVLSTEKTEQVYAVVVLLNKHNNWSTLKSDFEFLKKSYSDQYGKPEANIHHFTMPFNDVQDEMQKVELGMCDYSCSWGSPSVSLEITKSARIMITYENDAAFQLYAGL